METNQVLLWFVTVSLGLNAVAMWRAHGFRPRGWWLVLGLVSATLGAFYGWHPEIAGYVGATCWGLFILTPLLAARVESSLVAKQRLWQARWVANIARLLHPFDGWWQMPRLFHALELLQRGQHPEARDLLNNLQTADHSAGRTALVQLLRLDQRWEEMRDWVENSPEQENLLSDFTVAFNYVRALGELNDREAMLQAYERIVGLSAYRGHPGVKQSLRMIILALSGRPGPVEELFKTQLAYHDPVLKKFWIATAYQIAGDFERGATALERLKLQCDLMTRLGIDRRLAEPLPPLEGSELSPAAQAILDRLEHPPRSEQPHSSLHEPPPGVPRLTFLLIAANLLIFLCLEFYLAPLEILQGDFSSLTTFASGGSTEDDARLKAFGALTLPVSSWYQDAWRFVAANFLHYGWTHLTLNLFALWFFGRYLERVLGGIRFLLCYATAGMGAMLTVWFLINLAQHAPGVMTLLSWLPKANQQIELPITVVGASGSVMGLVGLTLMVSLRTWMHHRSHIAQQQLMMMGLLIVLQTTFDLLTPQVSVSAHLGGLVIGFCWGLVFRVEWQDNPQPATAS